MKTILIAAACALWGVDNNLTQRLTDRDPFAINQFGHPYQGSMYHGFARSAGLSYWESLGYTFAGSAGWEIAGEKTPPSKNDQIATGIGGSFFGEVLFRLSNLLLEGDDREPGFWHKATPAHAPEWLRRWRNADAAPGDTEQYSQTAQERSSVHMAQARHQQSGSQG